MTDAPGPGGRPQLSEAQQALLDALLAADGGAVGERTAAYVEPSSEVERLLARVWQEVLELPRVGVDDDYFAAGGDSIHAIVI
ncbi:MAG: phosphopantetheine-binding protein, partial [Pseudonocardiaceae bacterium]